jgi:hypothetical protein
MEFILQTSGASLAQGSHPLMHLFANSKILSSIITHLPVAGPVIGILTAVSSPLLWPFFFDFFWGQDLKQFILEDNKVWIMDYYLMLLWSVGIPISVFSGLALQVFLRSIITGSLTSNWRYSSLPYLISASLVCLWYKERCSTPVTEYSWELRIDPFTGLNRSYNIITQRYDSDPEYGKKSAAKRYYLELFHYIREPLLLFANRNPYTDKKRKTSEVSIGNIVADYNIQNRNLNLETMKLREKLFAVIDLLVLMKNTDLGSSPMQRTQTVKLINSQLYEKGLKDIERLLLGAEMAIITHSDEKKMTQLSELKEQMLKLSFSGEGEFLIEILLQNIEELDIIFKTELHYSAIENKDEKVTSFSNALFYDEIKRVVKYCTLMGIGVGGLYVMGKHYYNQ